MMPITSMISLRTSELHGGLHGLSKFLSLKIKVVVAVVSIAVVAAFFLKVFGAFKLFGLGHCDLPPPPPPPPHYEHVYAPPPVFEHDHHHDHHDIPYHSSSGAGSSYPSYSDTYSSLDSGHPAHFESSDPYKRKDMTGARGLPSFSIADLAFTVINVRSNVCRRKFVCEVDQRMKSNRLFEYAYSFISQSIFAKYRETHNNAKSYEDCAHIYSGCNHEIGTVTEEQVNTADDAEEFSTEVTNLAPADLEESVTHVNDENISLDNSARLLATHRLMFRH